MTQAIEVDHLSVSYYGKTVLDDVSFEAETAQLIGIIGPNGAGKSTMIKAIMGMIPTNQGNVRVLGNRVDQVRKQIAYVPQRSMIDFDFPVLVEDVVVMGRYPHLKWWQRPSKKDREKASDSLRAVGMEDYGKRQIGELSGGQQQRVFLARALAQESDVLFLDEPFAGIDVTSEEIIIHLLRQLKAEGKTIFVVHHDLSKVETYFDTLMMLNRTLIGYGKTNEVFTPDRVSETYDGNVARLSGNQNQVVIG
ncbi:iron/zinc/copper transport system ATP-binding protein [Pelagirhabdus alkalitolerans]|uniref:Iron/zinc/copper transport system ATP-binding protein n=1 Tax=Pelagirhabdus alkalitolerans TaxID=1612202 RepID=A0A1G6JHQ1_9BACI|nr:metal ABC transporter ATP-binding protein [Pelagirhabdus alkalitolerans]SDC18260.1 iron/zinc/copper transport system ATP-binding protein [Pelagirhabdus alkalitolerans]